jgi:hypothetical protein
VVPDGDVAEISSSGGLRAEFDSARRVDFDTDRSLRSRDLFLATNWSRHSHAIMIGDGQEAATLPLSERQAERLIERYRSAMAEVFWDGTRRRFDEPTPELPDEAVWGAVATLADIGREIWRGLVDYNQGGPLRGVADLRESENKVLHATRYDETFALPWAVVYDWDLPTDRSAPVCLGHGCAHGPESMPDQICMKGFWGYRHIIEESLASGGPDTGSKRLRPTQSHQITVAIGEPGPTSTGMVATLGDALGLELHTHAGGESGLYDALWREHPATAAAILIGHFDTSTLDSSGDGPPLQLREPAFEFRWGRFLGEKARRARTFPEPGPLVLLLGCSVANNDMSRLTDQVGALLRAGARAVVSTTSPVTVGLACHFASAVCVPLLRGEATLGEAVHRWRQLLLEAGNPLAFSIIPYGDADVHFAA